MVANGIGTLWKQIMLSKETMLSAYNLPNMLFQLL